MAKLYNFTVNTEFPAVAKTGTYSTTISQGSVSVPANDLAIVTQIIDVPSGDIICATIEVNGAKYPVQNYSHRIGGIYGGVVEQVFVTKATATQVQVVLGVWNETSSAVSHGAWSADVSINAFSVP